MHFLLLSCLIYYFKKQTCFPTLSFAMVANICSTRVLTHQDANLPTPRDLWVNRDHPKSSHGSFHDLVLYVSLVYRFDLHTGFSSWKMMIVKIGQHTAYPSHSWICRKARFCFPNYFSLTASFLSLFPCHLPWARTHWYLRPPGSMVGNSKLWPCPTVHSGKFYWKVSTKWGKDVFIPIQLWLSGMQKS